MKVLIAYAGKTGTTEKCATLLKENLKNTEVNLVNLNLSTPDISQYDGVIVGGSIRMGMLAKAAKQFVAKNKEQLLTKKCGYFICNGFPAQAESFLSQNIAVDLLEKAACRASFGGELDVEKLKGMDRFIASAVTKSAREKNEPMPTILHDVIREFGNMYLQ
ncbi:MAG: flavodoxin [Clostridiales bacterium]|nr:flavodoxin [Clostridiales bacterium]